MRQSQLFTKTRKEAPADEVSKNAELLIKAGYINKEMAGVYSYLPLGLLVFKKIENIIREEMNAINQQIAELEKRIESSKIKLAGLNKDREKIDLMRERYLSGNWKLQLSNMAQSAAAASSASASAEVSSAAPAPASSQTPSPSSHAEGRAARRAAREASSQPSAVEASESSPPEAITAAPQSPPLPEPVAEVAPEEVVAPVVASEEVK